MPESRGAGPDLIVCPVCGSSEWQAVEQISSLAPCSLVSTPEGVEAVFDARAELSREASTSVVTHYICANAECSKVLQPGELGRMQT